MQSTSIPNCTSCYYPIPKRFVSHFPTNSKSPKSQCTNPSFLTLTATTHSCSKEQEKKQSRTLEKTPLRDIYPPLQSKEQQFRKRKQDQGSVLDCGSDISSNMWWANFKAALGQRINIEGITCSLGIFAKDKHLVIPHVTVPDIRYIDWVELKNRGFNGVVFDKDNTITVPYSLKLWAPLESSIEQCKSVFGDNIAVFSNSAGLWEFDRDGRRARILEDAIGIKVIRHRVKKPAGSAEEIEQHFSCESSSLLMVGDRPFTDIVYGNRNGFFTILTEPLSLKEEPFIVRQVRRIETALVKRWSRQGLKPVSNNLIPDSAKCVKDVPL